MEPVKSCPDLMTESELIEYLRIPHLSKAKDHHNVVANLKRAKGLPCMHIANACLYPKAAIDAWILYQVEKES